MSEKKRDEHIASRYQQINDKQTARIREIREHEKKDREAKQKKVDQLTAGSFQNPVLHDELNKDISNVSGANGSNLFAVNPATHRGSVDPHEKVDRSNENAKMFHSARKEYFNSKTSHPSQQDVVASARKSLQHSRNDSSSNLKPRGLDPINASDLNHLGTHNITNATVNQTNQTTWNPSSKIAKGRQDVSFLQEKSLQLYAANANKKIPMDPAHGLLMSQSQLTSGDHARDDYLQVALGLRQIGKSIMDMPKSIDELRVLSNEYKKNLGATDEIHEE